MRTHDYFSRSKASSWAKLRGPRSWLRSVALPLLAVSSLLMGSAAWAGDTLQVTFATGGTGSVLGTIPTTGGAAPTAANPCATACTATTVAGAAATTTGIVTLKATPTAPSTKVVWSGTGCTTATTGVTDGSSIDVTLTSTTTLATNCTATFTGATVTPLVPTTTVLPGATSASFSYHTGGLATVAAGSIACTASGTAGSVTAGSPVNYSSGANIASTNPTPINLTLTGIVAGSIITCKATVGTGDVAGPDAVVTVGTAADVSLATPTTPPVVGATTVTFPYTVTGTTDGAHTVTCTNSAGGTPTAAPTSIPIGTTATTTGSIVVTLNPVGASGNIISCTLGTGGTDTLTTATASTTVGATAPVAGAPVIQVTVPDNTLPTALPVELFPLTTATKPYPNPTACVDFGYMATGGTAVKKTFTVGSAVATPILSVTSVNPSPFPDNAFTLANPINLTAVIAPALPAALPPTTPTAGVAYFDVTFDSSKLVPAPLASQTTVVSRQLLIYNNDPATTPTVNPLIVPIAATVVPSVLPKLQVADAAGNVIANGAMVDLGTTTVGTPIPKTFTIKNRGYSNLTLTTPFTVTSTSSNFTLMQPATTTLGFPASPGCPTTTVVTTTPTSTTFDLTFAVNTAVTTKTTYTGTVQLTSNDNGVTGSTFSFPVTVTVFPPPPAKPELQVLDENGNVLYSTTTSGTQPGTTTPFDFKSTAAGTAIAKKFTLKNISTATVTTNSLVFPVPNDPTKPSGFNLTGVLPTTIDPNSSKDITVTFSNTTAGTYSAVFQLFNNDADNSGVLQGDGIENPYTFPITATVTAGTAIPPGQSSLKVTVAGTGSISSSTPTGISSCTSAGEATCTANFVPGTVSLTATGGTVVWSGGCTGSGSTGTVNVVLNTPATCTATFTGGTTPPPAGNSKLTVAVTGNGSIASSTPTGISACTSANEPTCAANFVAGNVTLVANPTTGITWGSTCPNGTVTMDGTNAVTCAVTFTAAPPPVTQEALTITVVGAGSVSAPNTGLTNCTSTGGANCKANFSAGTVTMMATVPTGGSVTWGNGCSAGSTPDIGTTAVVVGTPATCTATFATASTGTALDVTVVGTGSISSSTPVGISNCTSAKEPTCAANFPAGAVTLTASPPTGATVAWSNGCTAGTAADTGTLTIVAGTPATCTATFTTPQPTTGDFTLKVVGTGSVASSPAGISDCTSAAPCNTKFPAGNVTLTAKPANTIDTVAWAGDCTGTGTMSTVTIVANTPAVCVATFTAGTPPSTGTELSVTVVGSGSVTSNPAGINACTSAAPCKGSFAAGNVTLTATPTNATDTVTWSTGCTGGTVTIVAGTPATCTATIAAGTPPVTTMDLTVTVVGNGNITSTPTGINACTSTAPCTAKFSTGTAVALNAVASSGANFDSWTGDCSASGKNSLIQVTMDAAKSCTANFIASVTNQTLTLTKAGSGTGTVTSEGNEINCGTTCTATVPQGNTLKLTATANTDSTFAGWGGDCSSFANGNPAAMMMDAGKSCTATFNLKTQEATCFSQGGLLTADGKCSPATSLTVESTTGTTATMVEGGASRNSSSGYGPYNSSSSVMVLLDLVKTAVALKVDPADKGQKADLLAAGLYVFTNTTPATPVWYMLVGCSTCPLGWNVGVKPLATGTDALPILTALEAYKPGVTLDSDYLTIPLYEGSLPEMGTLDIYAGYRITSSGKLVFNTTPIHLNIIPRP